MRLRSSPSRRREPPRKPPLQKKQVEHDVRVYDGVGHAFWEDMGQVERGERPQADAWAQCVGFLRAFFDAPPPAPGAAERARAA